MTPEMTGAPVHQVQPNWIAGRPVGSDDVLEIVHPWDGRLAGRVSLAARWQVDQAVAAADAVRGAAAALPAHVRAAALDHVQRRITERADEIARLITAESGKPLKWARVEVARAASVFRLAGEEARRWSGELQRLDTEPAGVGRTALIQRVPRGPVLGIAPFNFPLNLVAHKVAPAIAVGATVTAVDGVDAAFAAVNDSRYGLQAGVFTHDLRVAFRAQAELEVGGVVVGDVPTYRADQMPYGGVKESGVGREGVRPAMEDLTHERVMVLAV